MKISHLGHNELLSAIQRMVDELALDYYLQEFSNISEYREGNYDLLILDSRYFKPILLPNQHLIHSHVLVLGHYSEESVKQAFCINEKISYIAYSTIESELPHYLNHILAISNPET